MQLWNTAGRFRFRERPAFCLKIFTNFQCGASYQGHEKRNRLVSFRASEFLPFPGRNKKSKKAKIGVAGSPAKLFNRFVTVFIIKGNL
jgi:hypothetical protein